MPDDDAKYRGVFRRRNPEQVPLESIAVASREPGQAQGLALNGGGEMQCKPLLPCAARLSPPCAVIREQVVDHRGLVFSDVRVRVLDGAWLHRGVGDKALQEAGVVLGDLLAACVLWHSARWECVGVWHGTERLRA